MGSVWGRWPQPQPECESGGPGVVVCLLPPCRDLRESIRSAKCHGGGLRSRCGKDGDLQSMLGLLRRLTIH
jgi:hypothetical protein